MFTNTIAVTANAGSLFPRASADVTASTGVSGPDVDRALAAAVLVAAGSVLRGVRRDAEADAVYALVHSLTVEQQAVLDAEAREFAESI